MTIADKFCVEDRRAPRVPKRHRWRRRRAHNPSRLRRRGLRLRRHPQQETGDAGRLRGQRQLAACNEIEMAGFAPDFEHDGTKHLADERVGRRPQCALHVGGAHRHEKARIKTKFGEPAHRQRAGFNFGEILTDPNQRPMGRHPPRKPCDESARRSALPSLGKHLMHRASGEAALQRRIRITMPERHPAGRVRPAMRFKARNAAAQRCKRVHAPFL